MKILSLLILVTSFAACSGTTENEIDMPYSKADFEGIIDGETTRMFKMENKNGMVVTLTNYGAKIISVYVPDKNGIFNDVLLGFNSIEDYQRYGASHGAVVGPFANRIANAQFTIGEETYQLPVNNGEACLHSGPDSWYRKVWNYEKNGNVATFSLKSPDGEFGFPGNKTVKVTYTLTDDNELKLDYEVSTDKACHINVTNHSYFNLKGEGNGKILDHVLVINADKSTPVVDESMIPTGEIADIKGTPLDFTSPHTIGERIDADYPQLNYGAGYDFNYVINKQPGELAFAASAFEPESGRYMEVFTTEPGVQLYTGNHLQGTEIGNSGVAYTKRTGFCLETQHFPDSPNQPDFPSTLLQPGKVFKSTTIYKFSVKE
ncbi:aldose 1-epimerase [Tangfeifania diversioriginum]|uniref:Aldose 1-epimerase n=1 Tax=Tangfeifania diversioriginum TaxID=1168035 RepID=A0A1M6EAB9_9BACT|nr:aldose epimerase family protein [Tangfeifania diversioriginum]SHI82426.1 aldose 1-epimerase [Tangfeifania diversioriginum]